MQTLTPGSILGNAVRRREDPRLVTGRGHYVDDQPPTATAPVIAYSSASPSGVCSSDSAVTCGRQGGTHLLRDDSASVSFDVYDCGAGVGGTAQQSVTVASGGGA